MEKKSLSMLRQSPAGMRCGNGFRPSLDSLKLHTQSARITNTIPLPVHPKSKRWGIGVQVGYGMTAAPRPEFHPYIGLGISYNIFSF